jgi:ABC-type multidrug transport system ATPase subunit
MRQRLGVALAMMGQPRLLILDEHANGLDPAGIQDLRQLLQSLPGETEATVVLSSHILAEVEQVADHLVVIHRGRLRYQGPAGRRFRKNHQADPPVPPQNEPRTFHDCGGCHGKLDCGDRSDGEPSSTESPWIHHRGLAVLGRALGADQRRGPRHDAGAQFQPSKDFSGFACFDHAAA